jgi:hypothetical protein
VQTVANTAGSSQVLAWLVADSLRRQLQLAAELFNDWDAWDLAFWRIGSAGPGGSRISRKTKSPAGLSGEQGSREIDDLD